MIRSETKTIRDQNFQSEIFRTVIFISCHQKHHQLYFCEKGSKMKTYVELSD